MDRPRPARFPARMRMRRPGPSGSPKVRGAEFLDKLRDANVRRHTHRQIPNKGQRDANKDGTVARPMEEWMPTPEDALAYLDATRTIHLGLHRSMRASGHGDVRLLRMLEVACFYDIDRDVETLVRKHRMCAVPFQTGPGPRYADLLRVLAREDPPSFVVHAYNIWLAHASGGRLIQSVLERQAPLGRAYQTFTEPTPKQVRTLRNAVSTLADAWDGETQMRALDSIETSFQYQNDVLALLARIPPL